MNAEGAKHEVTVNLDKTRKLSFDFNSLCEFERITGHNLMFETDILTKPSALLLRTMLWCCLRTDDPELTIEEAGRFLNDYPEESLEGLKFAYERAVTLLTFDKKKVTEPDEAQDGTG